MLYRAGISPCADVQNCVRKTAEAHLIHQDRVTHCPKAKEWFACHVLKVVPFLPPWMLQKENK